MPVAELMVSSGSQNDRSASMRRVATGIGLSRGRVIAVCTQVLGSSEEEAPGAQGREVHSARRCHFGEWIEEGPLQAEPSREVSTNLLPG